MSQVDIQQVARESGMDQLTAKQYLQSEVFPKLEIALNSVSFFKLTRFAQLLETIEKNGEFEKYVEMLAEREERERKELEKRKRERDRLIDGDADIPDDTEEEEEPLSDWSASDSYDEQCDDVVSDFNVTADGQRVAGTPSIS